MKNLLVLITLSLTIGGNAQQDPKAKAILEKVSNENKTYQTIKAEFTYSLVNKADGINETQKGVIQIKGNKFHLVLGGQEVFSDGKTIYTVMKESEEVQISNPPQPNEENDIVLSPNNIFTIYEKGFKYKYGGKETVDGESTDLILLYPENPQKKNFHTVKLFINAKNQIKKIMIMGKDGSVFTYSITKFEVNPTVPDSLFVFNKSKYPNFEIIDLRE